MPKTLEYIARHLPEVTAEGARRAFTSIKIQDADAFASELQAFVHELIESVQLPASFEASRDVPGDAETLIETLSRKASALRADTRWIPHETDIQRGRAAQLEAFARPHNLPLPKFAQLASKSRQQIYKDIDSARLLALNVGPRGQKLPDWQLDPVKQQLTQAVLQEAGGIDNWTLYRALSEPLEGLGGRSPIDAVTADSIDQIAMAVFNVLGVH
jgi:hypothetical protein